VNLRLVLGPEAEAEIAGARNWYDERHPGLGVDFLVAVEAGLAAIKENPLQYQIVWKHIRRVGLRPFPYNLFYSVSDEIIRVVACIHGSRNPRVWRERT
jgi:plasmid stabilization system protein ParE